MQAKIKREFLLTIGTNDEKKTVKELEEAALELERYGNSKLPQLRVHIFSKENIEKQEYHEKEQTSRTTMMNKEQIKKYIRELEENRLENEKDYNTSNVMKSIREIEYKAKIYALKIVINYDK